jgi:nitrate/nitrite transporter NarK
VGFACATRKNVSAECGPERLVEAPVPSGAKALFPGGAVTARLKGRSTTVVRAAEAAVPTWIVALQTKNPTSGNTGQK